MATERDSHNANSSSSGDDMHHQREIGEGMHSPDSTQMPLKSENAEPDWRTQKKNANSSSDSERNEDRDIDRDRQSNR